MPLQRGSKRSAPQREPSDEPQSSSEQDGPRSARRRRTVTPADDDADDSFGNDAGTQHEAMQQLARKMVRYALACEYSRQPIRQAGVAEKVIPRSSGRVFKPVFKMAQDMLREVFGMEMVELPGKEKVTIAQRRAAATQDKQTTGTKSWILQSTLPQKYRDPDLIPPPQVPTAEAESAYIALYSFIIATIYLAGGTLPESKLERYLRRTNADRNTPVAKRDDLFKRLIRDQYIVKVRDTTSGEEQIEYMVGPRGKTEVGEEGVAGLVRTVYGGALDDLDKRLDRSLGIRAVRQVAREGLTASENGVTAAGSARAVGTQRGRRGRRTEPDANDESGSDEDSE